ncbi:MAG: polysaccharide pyruvyl transferase CsaB [Fimbriimonadia bacterium]|jgi:polysaccharide pyruvyl transferase CsaB
MEPKLVIAGYFGCGNLGDDAILAGFLEGIAGLPVRPMALSGHPERTRRTFSIGSVHRMNLAAVRESLSGAEALVFAGGSIFQDVTSIRSVYYYAKLVSLGKSLTGRVILLGQGFGPVRTWLGRRFVRGALSQVDAIAVRDEESGRLATSLGAKCEVRLTADMAWLAKPEAGGDGSFGIGDQGAVGLVPRLWRNTREVAAAFGGLSRHLSNQGKLPLLIPFEECDEKMASQMTALGHPSPTIVKGIRAPGALMARMERLQGVVTMRYHGALFAARAGIAPLLVSYDPKVAALAGVLGLPKSVPVEGLTADRLIAAWDEHERNHAALETNLLQKRQTLSEKALENIALLKRYVPSLKGENVPTKLP